MPTQLNFGGSDTLRSIVKSCLVLLATRVGTRALRGPAFKPARDMVLEGDEGFQTTHISLDGRLLPSPARDHLLEAHGPMFNLIYVRSDERGRTLAYFTLFNIISWQVVLAEEGGPADMAIGLASDPLEPARWDKRLAERIDVDFAWLDKPDRSRIGEETAKRMRAVDALCHQRGRDRLLSQIVDDVYARHSTDIKAGESLILDESQTEAALNEICIRTAMMLTRFPTQENVPITRADTGESPPSKQT